MIEHSSNLIFSVVPVWALWIETEDWKVVEVASYTTKASRPGFVIDLRDHRQRCCVHSYKFRRCFSSRVLCAEYACFKS